MHINLAELIDLSTLEPDRRSIADIDFNLLDAQAPNAVGIKVMQLTDNNTGDDPVNDYVALIPDRVGNHFHRKKPESYEVLSGEGYLVMGQVGADNNVIYHPAIKVGVGSYFVVPEGWSHQLVRHGHDPLAIKFKTPDSHMSNDRDRTLLPDAPLATIYFQQDKVRSQ